MARASSFFAAVALVLVSGWANAEVFYAVDFEDGDTEATVGTSQLELIDGSIESVFNPGPDGVNDSDRVGRFRVEASESKVRAELSSARLATNGETYRYRWSYYIPSDLFTGVDVDWFVVSQWKTWPCEVCNDTYDPAICGSCGGIFNDASIVDGKWEFRWRAEPDCYDYVDSVRYDQWVRFEMLVYWTTGSDGYVRLWQDGELVQSMDDIRTLFTSFESDTCDMYWALGLYSRWSGSQDHLELFVDDIEISDETEPPAGGNSTGGDSGVAGGSSGGGEASSAGGTGGSISGASETANGSTDDGGCGCQTTRGSSTVWGACLGLLLAVGSTFRRRKPPTSRPSSPIRPLETFGLAHSTRTLARHLRHAPVASREIARN